MPLKLSIISQGSTMADCENHARYFNPWVLHLQKLGLELKCPFCLDFYDKPKLLPCNHIFCSSCLPKSNLFGSDCPLCKLPYAEQDLREAPFMENMVNIYRNLDASFSKHMINSGSTRVSEQVMHSTKPNFPNQLGKQANGSSSAGNLTSDHFGIQSMGTKRVQALNNSSVMEMMEKGSHSGRSSMTNGTAGHFQTFESNLSSISHSHHGRPTSHEHEAVDFETNQSELSPDSPPSSGVSKGVEVDDRAPGSSDDTTEKRTPKNSVKRNVDCNEGHDAYLKKQKQLHQGPSKMNEGHSLPSMSMNMQNSTSTGTDMNPRSGIAGADHLAVDFDSTSLVNFTCAFCQSWKVSEASGPMQHFAYGKQVFGTDIGRSNVTHVHKSCIEWAPQTFYESDTVVKNLNKELARAAKLKCTSCGLKGAALGCYAKSCRRTYHVPCAYGIAKCRWDSEDFLMLCPTHSSQKFPSEKFKKPAPTKYMQSAQNCADSEHKNLEESDFWASSPTGAKNWVICGSALSADEKLMLVKFAKLCGATVTKAWTPNVTHVIAATDANGACSRTLKFLMAILKGRWILKTDWIKACMRSNCPVDEEPYEISLDNHGCSNGPKTGRLRVLNNAPELFSGLKFLFSGDFVSTYKNDIENLIRAAGGTILECREQLQQSCGSQSNSSTTFIIYNSDVMDTEDASQVSRGREEAERLAGETESQVIAHTWILDSISSSALQPFSQR